ncbi:replication factor C subunit 4-like [Pecten maximus]|uniref:replication factor C subunit 4-like n=1 Tax=Pecten maximus TaxID=6579 RepID=UPI0014580088|nr:replication factor C subunit 4-like [Pecten maximus]
MDDLQVVPDQTLDDLIVVCSSDSYEKLDAGIQGMINDGHSASQVITQMHEKLIEKEDLSDKQKAVIFEKLAVSERLQNIILGKQDVDHGLYQSG